LPLGHPARRVFAEAKVAGWRPPPRDDSPVTYPISDGNSWREGVDRAMSDDSGVDGDDW
jgi:hypothetical protein